MPDTIDVKLKTIYMGVVIAVSLLLVFKGCNNREITFIPDISYDQESNMGSTPYMALLPGEYEVAVHYTASEDTPIYIFRDGSGESFPAELSKSDTEYEFSLYLENYSDVVHITYAGESLRIEGIDISSDRLLNNDWFLLAALLFVTAVFLIYRDFKPLPVYAGIIISTAVLSYTGIPGKSSAFIPSLIRELRISMPVSVIATYLILGIFAAVNAYVASQVIFEDQSVCRRCVLVYILLPYTFISFMTGGDMGITLILSLVPHVPAILLMFMKRNRRTYLTAINRDVSGIRSLISDILNDVDTLMHKLAWLMENDSRFQAGTFLVLCALFLISRLYKLDKMIDGINADEIGTGYDALCIRDYGVDRWTTRMPVYFKNYSSGQNALYTYLASVVFRFTDFSLYALRLPAVICAFTGFIAIYVLAGKLFRQYRYRVVTTLFLIIWPVFFMSERWALESYLLHSLIFVSMTLLYIAIDSGGSPWYIAAGMAFGISLYTYAIAYILEPLFLLFTVMYLIWLKKVRLRNILCFAIPFVLLGLPLALEQMVNAEIIAPFSTVISDFVPMNRFRGEEFTLEHVLQNIKICYRLITADDRPYNGSAKFGTMYYISLPFITIGFVTCLVKMAESLKKRVYDYRTLIVVFFIISFLESLTVRRLNINRSNEIYFCFLLFAVYGVEFACSRLKKLHYLLIPLYAVLFIVFLHYYFGGGLMHDIWSSEAHALLWQSVEVGEAARDISTRYGSDKKLHILSRLDDTQDAEVLLLAAYEGVSPYEFNADRANNSIYTYGMPDGLDLTGGTIYLLDDDYDDIIKELNEADFHIDDDSYDNYAVAVK
ncbi:MAG: glycosyltransferase family 39 protein [Lachnospiraceae bacterium]|nr:glycosyltransferase family 39 protein [Lachnospiraceae bacterium]